MEKLEVNQLHIFWVTGTSRPQAPGQRWAPGVRDRGRRWGLAGLGARVVQGLAGPSEGGWGKLA